jgi:hypothetical protein
METTMMYYVSVNAAEIASAIWRGIYSTKESGREFEKCRLTA